MRCQDRLRASAEESNKVERDAKKDPPGQDQISRLTEEKTSLSSLIAEFDGIEDRLRALRQKRQELLQQLRDCRTMQNGLRKERADAIAESLNGRLDLRVEFKGEKENYKKNLSLLLNGSNISQDAIDQLALPEATDGLAAAESVRAGSK
jgi:uncharacterized coiled-coil DUF342 family protein